MSTAVDPNQSMRLRWLLVGAWSFMYYSLLSAKQLTWIFGSGDSADWLVAATSWQVPQPFGNPVFVLLGHALDKIPGDLVVRMTIVGSCLASAVTVAVTGAIAAKLTSSTKYGLLAVLILLGSAVFLTQSTVLSEYPLAVMAVVLAFWFYLNERPKAAVVCLGIGTAMHVVVGVIAFSWLFMEWQQGNLRKWLQLVPLFLLVSLPFYTLTLWEIWQERGLGLPVLLTFAGNTSGAFGLSVFDFPARLLAFISLVVVSLGAAAMPVWYGFKRLEIKGYTLALIPIVFVCWYYLTTRDPTVWHYLPWAMPFLAIFAAIGTQKLADEWRRAITPVVVGSAAMLLVVNSVWLNANIEAERNPVAMNLYRQYASLPYGAAVNVPRVGWEGFVFRYVQLNERPDLMPRPATISVNSTALKDSGYINRDGADRR